MAGSAGYVRPFVGTIGFLERTVPFLYAKELGHRACGANLW